MQTAKTMQEQLSIACVLVADTHSKHADIQPLPPGDVFIHAGDLSEHGTIEELTEAAKWINSLPYKYKIFIAGNHDYSLEPGHSYFSALCKLENAGRVASSEEESSDLIRKFEAMTASNTFNLHPERPYVDIEVNSRHLRVYGLPFSPLTFGPSAFMRDKSIDVWKETPQETRILVSYAPPLKVPDETTSGKHNGSQSLMAALERIRPALVVCGHVHEARGIMRIQWDDSGMETVVTNAAVMNRSKEITLGAHVVLI